MGNTEIHVMTGRTAGIGIRPCMDKAFMEGWLVVFWHPQQCLCLDVSVELGGRPLVILDL